MKTRNLFASAALIALASCQTVQMDKVDGMSIRASYAMTDFDLSLDAPGVPKEKASGDSKAIRVDLVSQAAGISNNAFAGLRFELGRQEASPGTAQIEVDTFSLGASFRGYAPLTKRLRPYGEWSVGYRHNEMRIKLAGFPDERGRGGGFYTGLAVGIEYEMARNYAIFAQVEYGYSDADVDGIDYQTDGVSLILGGQFTF